jgi:uncharacterized protein YutE (UPF0331/DUF86 family)
MRTELIKIKIQEIQDNLKIVEENLPDKYNEFKKLGLVKDGIYKKIESCLENVIDICSIINSDLKLSIPDRDENILDNLNKEGILSDKITSVLKDMKGFKNILVHRYGKINDEIAFKVLNEKINYFCK